MATDVSGLAASILQAAPQICDEAAHLMERDIASTAPIDTGALSRSGEVATTATGDGAVSTLRFTEDYADILDTGSGPHTITGNPLLSFQWGGQTVIVHSVEHPGSHKWDGWFSEKAGDESLWALQVQAVLSGTAII